MLRYRLRDVSNYWCIQTQHDEPELCNPRSASRKNSQPASRRICGATRSRTGSPASIARPRRAASCRSCRTTASESRNMTDRRDLLRPCRRARSASSAQAAQPPGRVDVGRDHAGRDRVDADAVAASSFASPMVIELIAPLEAAYQTYSPGRRGSRPLTRASRSRRPCPPCLTDMRGIAAFTHISAPSTLSSITSRIIAASAASRRELPPVMPAL